MPGAHLRRHLARAAFATALALAALGCANAGKGAAGSFSPRTANTLTVATAQIPDPGFWAGTFAHPTGGFEYGLAKQLAARLHLAKVKVVEVPFHELVRGHLGGADLALSDITITDERAEHLDFSTPYLKAPPAIVVRPGTEVADVNAARGLHWAVQNDTTLKVALERQIEPTTQTLVFEHQRELLARAGSRSRQCRDARPAGRAGVRARIAAQVRGGRAAAERSAARRGAAAGL